MRTAPFSTESRVKQSTQSKPSLPHCARFRETIRSKWPDDYRFQAPIVVLFKRFPCGAGCGFAAKRQITRTYLSQEVNDRMMLDPSVWWASLQSRFELQAVGSQQNLLHWLQTRFEPSPCSRSIPALSVWLLSNYLKITWYKYVQILFVDMLKTIRFEISCGPPNSSACVMFVHELTEYQRSGLAVPGSEESLASHDCPGLGRPGTMKCGGEIRYRLCHKLTLDAWAM